MRSAWSYCSAATTMANLRVNATSIAARQRSSFTSHCWQRCCAAGSLPIASRPLFKASSTRVGKGNRPSFSGAAGPELGRRLYEKVVELARARHPRVATGEFGADMKVGLVNDGPVTIPIRIT